MPKNRFPLGMHTEEDPGIYDSVYPALYGDPIARRGFDPAMLFSPDRLRTTNAYGLLFDPAGPGIQSRTEAGSILRDIESQIAASLGRKPQGRVVAVRPDMKGAERTSTILHEFGHETFKDPHARQVIDDHFGDLLDSPKSLRPEIALRLRDMERSVVEEGLMRLREMQNFPQNIDIWKDGMIQIARLAVVYKMPVGEMKRRLGAALDDLDALIVEDEQGNE